MYKLAAFLLHGALLVASQEMCGLTVKVITPVGAPFSGMPVQLIGPAGATIQEQSTDAQGIARFCDFGFGPHTLLVDDKTCLPVVVKNVRLDLRAEQTVTIVKNSCAHWMGSRGCSVYLRVGDESKRAIPSPLLEVEGVAEPIDGDRFGRLRATLSPNSSARFRVSAGGYLSRNIEIPCSQFEDIELNVTLNSK
ncbi:MAG: hypothetical protein ABI972_31630 [Acidobacteriota bacterium]